MYSFSRFLSSGSLIIISTAVEDTGKYVCFASNDAGHEEIAIYLSVLGKANCTTFLNIFYYTVYVIKHYLHSKMHLSLKCICCDMVLHC